MTTRNEYLAPYVSFNRSQWSALRKNVPLTLTEQDLVPLLGVNESLSLDEISTIYLPLVRLINYYIEENIRRQNVLHSFLDRDTPMSTYIIGIAGSVASGKSTASRILQALLSRWPTPRKVDLVATDGFLLDLKTLSERQLTFKKGFPESYRLRELLQFVSDVKAGKRHVKVPIYSQFTYDIIPDQYEIVDQPQLLILEGLNILQNNQLSTPPEPSIFISDFVDFSIYIDADEQLLRQWFLERFLRLREVAFKKPNSFFHSYSIISKKEAIHFANEVWININGVNLHENILPTRERAHLILTKGVNHSFEKVRLRH